LVSIKRLINELHLHISRFIAIDVEFNVFIKVLANMVDGEELLRGTLNERVTHVYNHNKIRVEWLLLL
jgi:hypothetical protein